MGLITLFQNSVIQTEAMSSAKEINDALTTSLTGWVSKCVYFSNLGREVILVIDP